MLWNRLPEQVKSLTVEVFAHLYPVVVIAHNRTAMWISNVFSVFKVFILLFIVVAGWVVLGGGTRVEDPHSHFKNGWAGTT